MDHVSRFRYSGQLLYSNTSVSGWVSQKAGDKKTAYTLLTLNNFSFLLFLNAATHHLEVDMYPKTKTKKLYYVLGLCIMSFKLLGGFRLAVTGCACTGNRVNWVPLLPMRGLQTYLPAEPSSQHVVENQLYTARYILGRYVC